MTDERDPRGRRLLTRNRSRVQLVAEQGDDGTYEIRVSPDASDGAASGDGATDARVQADDEVRAAPRRIGPWLSIGLLVAIGAVGAWMLVQDEATGSDAVAVPASGDERAEEEAGSSFRGFVIRSDGDEHADPGAATESATPSDPGRGVAGFVYDVPVEEAERQTGPRDAQRAGRPAQEVAAPTRRDPLRVEQFDPAMRRPAPPSAPVLDAEAMRNLQRVPVHRFVLEDDEDYLDEDLDFDDEDFDDLDGDEDEEDLDALHDLIERYDGVEW